MKHKINKLSVMNVILVILTLNAVKALPPPMEYTLEMFKKDLGSAHLVAQVQVIDLDTDLTNFDLVEYAKLRVIKCYKGGTQDFILRAKTNLLMVGVYALNYSMGQKSILCFTDSYRDGEYLMANARGKFNITANDSIQPPPVGLGFSSDFDYVQSLLSFEEFVLQILQNQEYIQFMPVLPKEHQEISFKTSIDLSGGAILETVMVQLNPFISTIYFSLCYTPCTGICPLLYLRVDTTIVLGKLAPGTYKAYREKINTLINGLQPPDDSVSFTVYAATSDIQIQPNHSGQVVMAWPNPFSKKINLLMWNSVREAQYTSMTIYDLTGKIVYSPIHTPNTTFWTWDGRDNMCRPMPSGAYLVRMQNGSVFKTARVVKN